MSHVPLQENDTFGRLPLLRLLDGEQLGGGEVERASDDAAGENLPLRVVGHHRVVIRLPGEGDFVFRRGQFLHQAQHGRVRFEVGIRLGEREQAAERAGERAFGAGEFLHRGGIAGIGGGACVGGRCGIARGDDGFERAAFVFEVTLRGLDQIRNQVVAPLELHVNLRVGVFETVAQRDEFVVDADNEHRGNQYQRSQHDEDDQ